MTSLHSTLTDMASSTTKHRIETRDNVGENDWDVDSDELF